MCLVTCMMEIAGGSDSKRKEQLIQPVDAVLRPVDPRDGIGGKGVMSRLPDSAFPGPQGTHTESVTRFNPGSTVAFYRIQQIRLRHCSCTGEEAFSHEKPGHPHGLFGPYDPCPG